MHGCGMALYHACEHDVAARIFAAWRDSGVCGVSVCGGGHVSASNTEGTLLQALHLGHWWRLIHASPPPSLLLTCCSCLAGP
jgi:hypothetical protein